MHAIGIVHRDIKPDNVLLEPPASSADGIGTPKLADFGLARPEESSQHLTQADTVLGMPASMAPEQTGLDPSLAEVAKRSLARLTDASIQRMLKRGGPLDAVDRDYLRQVRAEYLAWPLGSDPIRGLQVRLAGLARIYTLFEDTNQVEECLDTARAEVAVIDELAARRPADVDLEDLRIPALIRVREALVALARYPEAADQTRDLIAIIEALPPDARVPRLRTLAGLKCELGGYLQRLGRDEDSAAVLAEGLADMARLREASSAVPQISCVIFAEDLMFRELVASLLAIHARIHVVAQAGSMADWRRVRAAHLPELLLLLMSRSSGPSLAVARDFVAANPVGRVVAVAGARDRFRPPDWLAPHLAGTVDRDASIRALWGLIDSMVVAPPGNDGVSSLRTRLGGRSLSPREARIFQFIGEGLTSDQIADRLGLSVHTVRTHRKRIAAKLGTAGNDLTRWAIVAAAEQGAGRG